MIHKLLDVGCGPGTISNLGEYYKISRNYQIFGIDPDPQQIEIISNRYPAGKFSVGRAEKLPFPPNTFDAVLIRHVLEHVNNPEKTLREISRVSKSRAELLIAVPHPKFEMVARQLTPEYLGSGHHHQRIFDRDSITSLITGNGYIIEKINNNMWPLFVIVTAMELFAKVSGKIKMEEQSGVYLVGNKNYLKNRNLYLLFPYIYAILDLLNRILWFFNQLIPFEISVRARKKSAHD